MKHVINLITAMSLLAALSGCSNVNPEKLTPKQEKVLGDQAVGSGVGPAISGIYDEIGEPGAASDYEMTDH